MQVFTAFWGPEWASGTLSTLAGQVNAFFDAVLVGALMDQLAEYDVDGHHVGKGTRIGTANVTSPTLGHSASDTTVQRMLQAGNRRQDAAGAHPEHPVLRLPPAGGRVRPGRKPLLHRSTAAITATRSGPLMP